MKNSEKTATDSFLNDSVQSESEVVNMGGDPEQYCDIYRELLELLGENAVHKLWNRYRGVSIQFPQRLYSREYTRRFIMNNMEEMKPKEMAQRLNLTERRIRQIMQEIREELKNEQKKK